MALKLVTPLPRRLLPTLIVAVGCIHPCPASTNFVHEPRQIGSVESRDGGVLRGPKTSKEVALVFTGHSYAEGAETILNELRRHRAKASFFLTGDFLANTNFASLIRRMVAEGHFLGPHSDKHLLYCAWNDAKKTLVSRREFEFDLESNLQKIEALGLNREQMRYFLPAYEHHNSEIAAWTREAGLALINFTPGTRSNADYTGESDTNFVSSKAILASIFEREKKDPNGLNGFLLLLHVGSGPARADKFHSLFGELLDYLDRRGYKFVRVDELLGGNSRMR